MTPQLVEIHIADAPARWEALGFNVDDGLIDVGGVRLRLEASEAAWALSGVDAVADIDGVSTTAASEQAQLRQSHPNGAVAIDHVVVISPDFERTQQALEDVGITLSRIRDGGGFRQGFRRLGPAILELVEAVDAPAGPARLWGLVVTVDDLPGLATRLGEHLTPVKAAVQSGRHITTLRRSAGLSLKLAFMD